MNKNEKIVLFLGVTFALAVIILTIVISAGGKYTSQFQILSDGIFSDLHIKMDLTTSNYII